MTEGRGVFAEASRGALMNRFQICSDVPTELNTRFQHNTTQHVQLLRTEYDDKYLKDGSEAHG